MNELLQESDFGPARFGPYHRVRELGTGAMGAVLEVQDERTGARYALKVILPDALDADTLARFQREAHAMAQLNHPHVARIRGAQLEPPLRYLVLDLYPGGTLRERMQRGPLPWAQAADLVGKLADGVAHAHAKRILHRDIKPTNVLFDADDEPVLTDFGLARAGDASRMTRTGELLGTPLYMAPEQVIDGKRTGPAADVYALGALLYLTLTGRPPIEAGFSLMETLDKVVTQVPPPPSELVPGLPAEVDALCRRALAKEPDDRPSAAELARGLRGLTPHAASKSRPRSTSAPLLAAAGLAALCGALLTAYLYSGSAREEPSPPALEQPPQPPAGIPPWIRGLDGKGVALSLHEDGETLTLLAQSSVSVDTDGGWSWTLDPRAVRTRCADSVRRYLAPQSDAALDSVPAQCAQLCAGPTVLRFDAQNRVQSASGPAPTPSGTNPPTLSRLVGELQGDAFARLTGDLLQLLERRGQTPQRDRLVVTPAGPLVAAVRSTYRGWVALQPVELGRDRDPKAEGSTRTLSLLEGASREVPEGLLLASNGLDDPDYGHGDPTRSFDGWLELPLPGADARLRDVRPPFEVVFALERANAFSRPFGSPLGALLFDAGYLKLAPAREGWVPIAWQGGEAWVPEAEVHAASGKPWIGCVVMPEGKSLNVRFREGDKPLARPRLGALRAGQRFPMGHLDDAPSVATQFDGRFLYAQTPPLSSWCEIPWGPRRAWVRASIPVRGGHHVYLFVVHAGLELDHSYLQGRLPEQTVVVSSSTQPR